MGFNLEENIQDIDNVFVTMTDMTIIGLFLKTQMNQEPFIFADEEENNPIWSIHIQSSLGETV